MNILDTIGNTPMVKLKRLADPDGAAVYVKLEYFNPTASYKDRMARAVIEAAEKKKELREGMTVIENTAGSTGTSLAFVCAAKGYPFRAISSNAFSKEKLRAIELFGGSLELIDNEGRGITPDLVPRMIERARSMSTEKNYFWARQFENPDVLEGYAAMTNEMMEQSGGPIHTFCAGVGTAGMFAGTAKMFRALSPATRLIALEPASAPLISKGIKGTHEVEGIAPGFIPPFLELTSYDEVHTIEETEARVMAKHLVSDEGIFAGTSTGLNVAAAIRIAKKLQPSDIVVTVACDSGLKYLSTSLFRHNADLL